MQLDSLSCDVLTTDVMLVKQKHNRFQFHPLWFLKQRHCASRPETETWLEHHLLSSSFDMDVF
jgi:hypothetical protein